MSFQFRFFFRIISRNKEVYLLKIISLAIAFGCSTLVILFSFNEFGYDRFHQQPDSIFRLLQRNNTENHSGNRYFNRVPAHVIRTIKSNLGDSVQLTPVKTMLGISVMTEDQNWHDEKMHAVGPEITSIFSFQLLEGSLSDFTRGKSAILSAAKAQQFFGTIKAVGKKFKVFTYADTLSISVAAVFQNFPANSHEEFSIFLSRDSDVLEKMGFEKDDAGAYGRVLRGKANQFNEKIIHLFKSAEITFEVQPLPDIYFGRRVIGEDSKHGDSYSVWIVICITALILFLALTSFVNLTTLTLPYRAKELAIKKLAGTSQSNLSLLFAMESFILVGTAGVIGIGLLILTSNWLEPILSVHLILLMKNGSGMLIWVMAGLLIISGLSPLLMTRKFTTATPTRLLSTEAITFPRFKSVIGFLQLGISIFLIVASVVIRRQVNYSLLKEPGRNHEQIVYVDCPTDLTVEGLIRMREGWKKYHPNIEDVIGTSQLPNHIHSKEINSELYGMSVDPVFFDFFNLKLAQGRWFKVNDRDSIVVTNERGYAAAKSKSNLIGVIRNMNGIFNKAEKPVVIRISDTRQYRFLCIRILEVDIRRTVNYLADYFKTGNAKAKVSFLNKRFEEWLTYQDRLNWLSGVLAVISGLLSCCAIYGLSVSMLRDKLKQIAVHKLYGASTWQITAQLAKGFIAQMLAAAMVFGPLTYLLISEWLRKFVYSTKFNWMDPAIPLGYCTIIIALLCAFQALSLNRADLNSALK